MRVIRLRPGALAVAAGIVLALVPQGGADGSARSRSAAKADVTVASLQALADSYVSSNKLAGIVIAVGRGDAAPHFIQAGSLSDDPGAPPAGPDSLWRIYSMTKPITGIAAMMLVEDGKIGLDQPVADFIPAFLGVRVLNDRSALDSHPAVRPMTVRHLLTHSGGLTYQFMGTQPIFAEYRRLGLLGGRADPESTKAQPATLAEFADRAASLPLITEPGSKWNYSISSDVLGRVIEVASGMPFERFVQTRLFEPLGMESSYWTVPRAETTRLSTEYYWRDERRIALDRAAVSGWQIPPKVHYGGSGLVTSARDYDRFLRMLAGYGRLDGVRVLKRQTVRRAMSNLLPAGVSVEGIGTPDTSQAKGFGAGGWVYLADVPHGVRAGTFGWSGVGGTIAFIDPKQRLRVTVMSNNFPGNKWPIHADVVRLLYAGSGKPTGHAR